MDRGSRGVTGGCTAPTADVQNAVSGGDGDGVKQDGREPRGEFLVAPLVRDPVLAFGSFPLGGLVDVHNGGVVHGFASPSGVVSVSRRADLNPAPAMTVRRWAP